MTEKYLALSDLEEQGAEDWARDVMSLMRIYDPTEDFVVHVMPYDEEDPTPNDVNVCMSQIINRMTIITVKGDKRYTRLAHVS